ncbi:MAG: FAD:protein FMN transferase, partial [Spirochaetaceae bacterium]|jgi:thiamine biosynthesis lipoprotein|nr:FAD:protein FMN transferase [Spirochaetaceae bacterium]
VILICLAGCSKDPAAKAFFAMGTVCRIRIYQKVDETIFTNIISRVNEIEHIFSTNIKDSEINKINDNAGIAPSAVSPELVFVLEYALLMAQISGGVFDPTIGALVRLWGIGTDEARLPEQSAIDEARALTGWERVEIDKENNEVFLTEAGMALDVGAIAKGYAADETLRLLWDAGIEKAIIDFGGNILALGSKQQAGLFRGEMPWTIGIQDPNAERGVYTAIAMCRDATLVTSGVYERFFVHDGVRYHHILSPQTGFPVDNELLSVTIVSSLTGVRFASMEADALSTTAFALGYDKAAALLKTLPGRDAVFIFKDGTISATRKGLIQ